MDHFETMHTCCGYIEDVHVTLNKPENNFLQNYGILDLENFQVRLHLQVRQFETLHRCYKHIEDMHVTFNRQENHF